MSITLGGPSPPPPIAVPPSLWDPTGGFHVIVRTSARRFTQQFPSNKGEQTKGGGEGFFCLGELRCACMYLL